MLAGDVMTRDVVTVHPETSLSSVVREMLERRFSGVPVVNGNRELVGIVTEGDLLRRAELGTAEQRPRWLDFLLGDERLAEDYVRTHGRRVADVMTRDVISATPDTPLREIAATMDRKNIRRMPIVTGKVCVGIVSRLDLLRVLHRMLENKPHTPAADAEIREQILREIKNRALGGRNAISVTAANGVVHLDGIIYDERDRAALRVAAENAAGVVEVKDHLTLFAVSPIQTD